MSTEKKWMALVIEIISDEDGVQSIAPVDAETGENFTVEELEAIHKFLREDDDASLDFMWDLRSRVRDAINDKEELS